MTNQQLLDQITAVLDDSSDPNKALHILEAALRETAGNAIALFLVAIVTQAPGATIQELVATAVNRACND